MRALIGRPPTQRSVRLEDAPEPEPGEGQALLSILTLGIDGTDMEIDRGVYGRPPDGRDRLIVGHEALAKVEDVNGGAPVSKGDLVVPTVRRPCPEMCVNCRAGEEDKCRTGGYLEHGIWGLDGFAADYGVTDAGYLVKVPPEVRATAVLAEPLSVVENALAETWRSQTARMHWEPSKALVLGAGAIGQLSAMALLLRGLDVTVSATSPADGPKADMARRIGAKYVNVKERPLTSSKDEYDVIIEATGASVPALDAMSRLSRNGALCLLGIYPGKESSRDFGGLLSDMVLKEQLIIGSVSARRESFEQGFRDMAAFNRREPGVLESLITRRVPLESFRQALEPEYGVLKTVIDIAQ